MSYNNIFNETFYRGKIFLYQEIERECLNPNLLQQSKRLVDMYSYGFSLV